MSELQDALKLRRTTNDYERSEEENERLDHLIYEAARQWANLGDYELVVNTGPQLMDIWYRSRFTIPNSLVVQPPPGYLFKGPFEIRVDYLPIEMKPKEL